MISSENRVPPISDALRVTDGVLSYPLRRISYRRWQRSGGSPIVPRGVEGLVPTRSLGTPCYQIVLTICVAGGATEQKVHAVSLYLVNASTPPGLIAKLVYLTVY